MMPRVVMMRMSALCGGEEYKEEERLLLAGFQRGRYGLTSGNVLYKEESCVCEQA